MSETTLRLTIHESTRDDVMTKALEQTTAFIGDDARIEDINIDASPIVTLGGEIFTWEATVTVAIGKESKMSGWINTTGETQ